MMIKFKPQCNNVYALNVYDLLRKSEIFQFYSRIAGGSSTYYEALAVYTTLTVYTNSFILLAIYIYCAESKQIQQDAYYTIARLLKPKAFLEKAA
ncbi:hypothetical protein U3516DRAFT_756369 [Neocallimastix sp. 'constans']